jgi:hypothetical protein
MTTVPTVNDRVADTDDRVDDYVSAAFRRENVGFHGSQEEVLSIAATGLWGAVALAGLSVIFLIAMWFAFFLFVFLPRGTVG